MYPGKRLFDLIVAALALVVLSPVILACAIVVRLTSPGPAIYAGVRAGYLERPFGQLKFRTMGLGADRGGFQTAEGDPRITRAGRWLRKTSLDELPQLVNVLRGDMSLVGPRPAAIRQLTLYTPEDRRERAKVRPGITGLAQVSGRSDLPVADAIKLDVEYVHTASLRLDLDIIGRTFATITRGSGSN
jgi:lipopolysaccharide/colanic/teichoic acid biosynthesis glycosyltransferase